MREKIYQEQEAFMALVSGNERGFDFYFNLYYTPLVFYSIKFTNNREAAKDIVSETYIKFWNNKESISEYRKVKYLLYRMVYNASIDYLRKQNINHQVISNLTTSNESVEGNVLENLIETETYHHLYVLLSKLPFRCRQIFQMFYFQDKAIKEIAEELGISVNTVKSQKQRALQLLKERHSFISFIIAICLLFSRL